MHIYKLRPGAAEVRDIETPGFEQATGPDAAFNDSGRLVAKAGRFLEPLMFCFIMHELTEKDGELAETLDFLIWQRKNKNETREIFRETLVIDQKHFSNLINWTGGENKRNRRLLTLADEILRNTNDGRTA
jgi:hypothetical protein